MWLQSNTTGSSNNSFQVKTWSIVVTIAITNLIQKVAWICKKKVKALQCKASPIVVYSILDLIVQGVQKNVFSLNLAKVNWFWCSLFLHSKWAMGVLDVNKVICYAWCLSCAIHNSCKCETCIKSHLNMCLTHIGHMYGTDST